MASLHIIIDLRWISLFEYARSTTSDANIFLCKIMLLFIIVVVFHAFVLDLIIVIAIITITVIMVITVTNDIMIITNHYCKIIFHFAVNSTLAQSINVLSLISLISFKFPCFFVHTSAQILETDFVH